MRASAGSSVTATNLISRFTATATTMVSGATQSKRAKETRSRREVRSTPCVGPEAGAVAIIVCPLSRWGSLQTLDRRAWTHLGAGREPVLEGLQLGRFVGAVDRQVERNRAADSLATLRGQRAAVLLHDLTRASQADTCAADGTHVCGSKEPLEYVLHFRGGNA